MEGTPVAEKDVSSHGKSLLDAALESCRNYEPLETLSAPADAPFTSKDLVDTTMIIRKGTSESASIADTEFFWNVTGKMGSLLHDLDFRHRAGALFGHRLNHHTRKAYAVSSMMEESASSAALSGAMIRPRNAKKMMRDGRSPKSNGEGSAQRAYNTLVFAAELAKEQMSQKSMLRINAMLSGSETSGIRTSETAIRSRFSRDPEMAGMPPYQVPAALADICKFVNDASVHPLIRAFGAEFMIVRLQPFASDNEVTARTIRFWCLERNGYDIASYLSISGIMKSRTPKYQKAFSTSAEEGNDMTYALSFCLESMVDSITAFLDYVDRKTREQEYVLEGISMNDLSARQRAVLADLSRSSTGMTISEVASKHQVSYQTARADLLLLAMRGLASKGGRDGHKDTYVRTESSV